MIIGKGLVAKALESYFAANDSVLLFASGVSNSNETSESEFFREEKLIQSNLLQVGGRLFIYVSTYSILDPDAANRPYILHKKKMEQIIQSGCKNWLIVRASNLVGATKNVNTIFNFFSEKIKSQQPFELWVNAKRNLLDIDDFRKMLLSAVSKGIKNKIIYLVNPSSVSVLQLVKLIEDKTGSKAKMIMLKKGSYVQPPVEDVNELGFVSDVNFSDDYVLRLIDKYLSEKN